MKLRRLTVLLVYELQNRFLNFTFFVKEMNEFDAVPDISGAKNDADLLIAIIRRGD